MRGFISKCQMRWWGNNVTLLVTYVSIAVVFLCFACQPARAQHAASSLGISPQELDAAFQVALQEYQENINLQNIAVAQGRIVNQMVASATRRHQRTTFFRKKEVDHEAIFSAAVQYLIRHGRIHPSQVGALQTTTFEGSFIAKSAQEKCLKDTAINLCRRSPYRTLDGSCNNLLNPQWGVAEGCQLRLLPPVYEDGVNVPKRFMSNGDELPNPRFISEKFLEIIGEEPTENRHTTMMQGFGQFVDHDIILTPTYRIGQNGSLPSCCPFDTNQIAQCFPIYLRPGDRFFGRLGLDCMNVVRSVGCPACTLGYRNQINSETAVLDLSNIYGLNDTQSLGLRQLDGTGRLLSQRNDLLPPTTQPVGDGCSDVANNLICFRGGDARVNQQIGITSQTITWHRQHNWNALRLKERHPDWSDDELFFEARRITGAQMQMVTYNEFLPKVLGPDYMKRYGLTYDGPTKYNPDIDPGMINEFGVAAYRFGHALIRNTFWAIDLKGRIERAVPLRDAYSRVLGFYRPFENDKIMLGFSVQPGKVFGPSFVTGVTNDLYRPLNVSFGMDLPAINIHRSRDHGIRGYPEYLKLCGGKSIHTWEDLTGIWYPKCIDSLRDLYAAPIDVDLFPGGLCEKPVPGGMVGPTFACIIGTQFHNLRYGDRFFFTHQGEEGSFTHTQLRAILESTLYAKIICQTSEGIENIHEDVFLQISSDNPIHPCQSYPDLDYSAWD